MQDDPPSASGQPVVVGPQRGAGPPPQTDPPATEDAPSGGSGSAPAGSGGDSARQAAAPDDASFGRPLSELMASAPASHSGRKAHPTLVAATELPIYVASTAPTEPEAAVPVHSKHSGTWALSGNKLVFTPDDDSKVLGYYFISYQPKGGRSATLMVMPDSFAPEPGNLNFWKETWSRGNE